MLQAIATAHFLYSNISELSLTLRYIDLINSCITFYLQMYRDETPIH